MILKDKQSRPCREIDRGAAFQAPQHFNYNIVFLACKEPFVENHQFLRFKQKIIVNFVCSANCKDEKSVIEYSHRKGRYRPMKN